MENSPGPAPAARYVGAAAACVVGYVMAEIAGNGSWRRMLASGAVLGAVILLMRIATPESPLWLVNKGRAAEAQMVVPLAVLGGGNALPIAVVIVCFCTYALLPGGPAVLEWTYPNEFFPHRYPGHRGRGGDLDQPYRQPPPVRICCRSPWIGRASVRPC
ncbi:MFS transporter [Streptomyces sp. NPDC015127]|uniref:MFS transporter n=1 Tax=Streptomyces sp. NPDC015127 TaxID=3364939 RepID=UPI0036FE3AA0